MRQLFIINKKQMTLGVISGSVLDLYISRVGDANVHLLIRPILYYLHDRIVLMFVDVPLVTIRNVSYNVTAGSNLEISCKINSVPRHNYVYWEKLENGTIRVIIHGAVGFDGITVESPSLLIPKVDVLMNGQYRCIATNAIGTGSSLYTTLTGT